MSNRKSLFGAFWKIYTFPLVFMVFMSFSSENAGGGFYQKYYAFLFIMCVLALVPFSTDCLRYLKRKQSGTTMVIGFIGTVAIWNGVASGFNLFYSIVIIIVFLVGATIFVLGQVRPNLMIGLMRAVILINVGALLYQYLQFGVTGEVKYLHGEVFPFSRDTYFLSIGGGALSRFTGLHIEPGGYSTMMTLALIYYRSLTGRLDYTFVIGMISVPFTFATVAMIYLMLLSVIFLFEIQWRRPRNFLVALIIFTIVFRVLIFDGVLDVILSRFSGGYEQDSSLNFKVMNVLSYTQFSFIELLTGLGIEQIDADCYSCNYVKSNGVLFYLLYTLGILGLGIIVTFMLRTASNGLICFVLGLILLLCRYPMIVPVFWVSFLALWNWHRDTIDAVRNFRDGSRHSPIRVLGSSR